MTMAPIPFLGGEPLQVIYVSDNKLSFYRNNLLEVVSKCDNRPLVIYSVAGEFRKGKSFLLNLFLLFNHYKQNGSSWMNKTGLITGFKAKGGSERVTTGVWFWSEPIFTRDKNDQELAVLLMDTQGTFDRETTSAVNSFIFGFSLSVSSVMMFNVKDDINEQQLDNLVVFAQSIHEVIGTFQSLKFLVRDWLDDDRYAYGSKGGQKMIDEILGRSESETAEPSQLTETRQVIRRLFPIITCFLFPPPGDTIARGKKDPVIESVNDEFKTYVDALCQELFVENLTPRETRGQQWTGETLLAMFDTMKDAHREGRTLDPGTFRETQGKKLAHAANQVAYHFYMEQMEKRLFYQREKTRETFVDHNFLINVNEFMRGRAIKEFRDKMNQLGSFDEIEGILVANMETWYNQEVEKNQKEIEKQAAEKAKKQAEKVRDEAIKKTIEAEREQEKEEKKKKEEEFQRHQRKAKYRIEDIKEKKGFWSKCFDAVAVIFKGAGVVASAVGFGAVVGVIGLPLGVYVGAKQAIGGLFPSK